MSNQTHITDITQPATATTAGETAPVVHGAVILSTVETAWNEIRRRFTDVPGIFVTVPPAASPQNPTKCTALRTGRHFIRNGQPTMELQVSSATLGDLRHGHALGGQQHHPGPPPGDHRPGAPADGPQQPSAPRRHRSRGPALALPSPTLAHTRRPKRHPDGASHLRLSSRMCHLL